MASNSAPTRGVLSDTDPTGRRFDPLRILAVDVGAGTQDILVYDSGRTIENSVKLVLPSQTQVVAARIRRASVSRRSIHLSGSVMSGGASSAAIEEHLAAGLMVSATEDAARSIHNDLERVRTLGITIRDEPMPGDEVLRMTDLDLDALRMVLDRFGVELPSIVAVAVQDHGYLPGAGGREFRYEFLQSLLAGGGDIVNMVYRDVPEYMIRMRAVRRDVPGVVLMDTGAAAVLGALGDPVVARRANDDGAIIVNIGNMHTFGVAMRGRRIFGLFEHHTGGITPASLASLVERLGSGRLTHDEVVAHGGHGAAFHPDYSAAGPFAFVAITGPNRRVARALEFHEAAPHGDMMLTGSFGLVEGVMQLLATEGYTLPVSSLIG